jgi:hypothetical protein
MRKCRVFGCDKPAVGRWRALCNGHHCRQRRHGHAEQVGVPAAALTFYRKHVRERIKKNVDSSLWSQLEDRWRTLVDHCRATLAAYHAGRPGYRYEWQAAHALLKVADEATAREVIETVLAIHVLLNDDPRRFRSDEAFLFQVTRRVRGLAYSNAGEYYDHTTGKTKRVYRDLHARATLTCGQWLNEAFGLAGLHLANLKRQEVEVEAKAREQFHAALTALR